MTDRPHMRRGHAFEDLPQDVQILWDRDCHQLLCTHGIYFQKDWNSASEIGLVPVAFSISDDGTIRLQALFRRDRWFFRREGSLSCCPDHGVERYFEFLARAAGWR